MNPKLISINVPKNGIQHNSARSSELNLFFHLKLFIFSCSVSARAFCFAWAVRPSGTPSESRREKPAHVPADASVARMITVGAKAIPAAFRRIHQGKASLQMIS